MKIRSIVLSLALAIGTISVAPTFGCERGIEKYDTLVDKDELCTRAWSDYGAALQRRSDLIPGLVEIVKGSAAHESSTLTAVIEARSAATQIKLSADDYSNPVKMKAFNEAQDKIKGSLSRLMMVQESYPDLKANSQFHDLMIQVEGTENRILIARRDYNTAVMNFNTELRHVSGKVINPITKNEFKQRVYFEADAAANVAPKISFAPASSSK